jgi:DNA polymerase-3 subunit delta'
METKPLKLNWGAVGHQKVLGFFENSLANRSVGHAYLFVGPQKTGKTTIAKTFARFLVCQNYMKEDKKMNLGCGACDTCKQFDKGMYSDYIIVERELDEKKGLRKQKIVVSQVRDVQERLSKRSFLNSSKVVIIPDADRMTEEASNSLLKTLEEPSPNTVLILVTTSPGMLLPTIVSRCQTFHFLPVATKDIYDALVEKGANRDTAKELSDLACGRPTVARELYEDQATLQAYRGLVQTALTLLGGDTQEKFALIDQYTTKHKSVDDVMALLQTASVVVRDLLLVKSYNQHLAIHPAVVEAAPRIQAKMPAANTVLDSIEQAKVYLRSHIHPKFVLEQLFIFE